MHVVVRADGGAAIGLGHVMRCLALCEALGDRGARVTFLTRASEPRVLAKIRAAGCAVATPGAGEEATRARAREAAAVVVDLYGVTTEDQAALRAAGARLLVIDDLAAGHFVADLVLNQNLGASAAAYSVAPHTRLLLGPRYALLRRAFRAVSSLPAVAAPPRLLVTMGGADPTNATARAVEAVDVVDADFTVDVIVGAAFAAHAALDAVARSASHAVEVHRDPEDLPVLMARATLAVSAAGSTSWELAHLGVPAVVLVLAANQAPVAAALAAAGVARSAGDAEPFPAAALGAQVAALLADPAARQRMAAAGRALVDGRGAERVADLLVAA